MKNLKRSLGILAFTFLMIGSIFAQGEKPNREEMEQKMKVMKVSFITEQLDFTEDEAMAFWPVYNNYEDEMKALRPSKGKEERPNVEELSDGEIEGMIMEKFAKEFKKTQVQEVYFEKFKIVLPMQKILKLYKAEQAFKKEIIAKFKERKQGL
jgi:hypothetical protein